MKERMLGYELDQLDIDECCDEIFSYLATSSKRWLACFNPHTYVVSLNDFRFESALKAADWLVPDGAGVVLASRLLGGSIVSRITGSDIFLGLSQRMNEGVGIRVFFLGSTEDTLSDIRMRMAIDYPNIIVAGTYSPPYKPEYTATELTEMIEAVNSSGAEVLWVGMTAPKQEKWIFENISELDVKFAGAIGAVFDFYTGRIKRSHPFFQKIGLEWLPRLLQQPKRLWRRTLVSAPIFIWHVFLQRLSNLRGD